MNCLCGCGTALTSPLVKVNLQAGEVALELFVWARARASMGRGDGAAVERVDGIIDPGARLYRTLLGVIHGELEPLSEDEVSGWLGSSRANRKEMAKRWSSVPKGKVKLADEELERLDRRRPELSFARPTSLLIEELRLTLLAAEDPSPRFDALATGWLTALIEERSPSLDEVRWVVGQLEAARVGRAEAAGEALRGFLEA